MNPYPFELLNHFTVPCTYKLLLVETRMFLLASELGRLHPALTNCAECTRKKFSVKRAFTFLAIKKATILRIKSIHFETSCLSSGSFDAWIPRNSKRIHGLLFLFHSVNHLFRKYDLARKQT